MTVRESPDELTLRAEEVGTSKSLRQCRPHGKGEVGSFPWQMLTGSKEKTGESHTMLTKK